MLRMGFCTYRLELSRYNLLQTYRFHSYFRISRYSPHPNILAASLRQRINNHEMRLVHSVTKQPEHQYTRPDAKPGMFAYEEFSQFSYLDKNTQKGLRYRTKFSETSKLQSAVLGLWPIEDDVLVVSSPGTGKSLAMLVPAIEKTLDQPRDALFKNIRTIVVTQTRDRAFQLFTDAKLITTHHLIGTQSIIGGEPRMRQSRLLYSGNTDIMIGTPGRLLDILQSEAEFMHQCKGIKLLILDNADGLMEGTVKDDLQDLLHMLPTRDYQAWIFAQHSTHTLRNFANEYLRPNYINMDLHDPERYIVPHTTTVLQRAIIAPWEIQHALMHKLIVDKQKEGPAKIMIFLPTDSLARLYGCLFEYVLPRTISTMCLSSNKDIHARRDIERLYHATKEGAVLVTSDKEGWDIGRNGDVDMVIHLGPPARREEYGDRITRLIPKDTHNEKKTESVMILAPELAPYLNRVLGEAGMKKEQIKEQDMVVYEGLARILTEAKRKFTHSQLNDACISFKQFLNTNQSHLCLDTFRISPAATNFINSFGLKGPQSLSSTWETEARSQPSQRTIPTFVSSSTTSTSQERNEPNRPMRDSCNEERYEANSVKENGNWKKSTDQRIQERQQNDKDPGKYDNHERVPGIQMPVSKREWKPMPIIHNRPGRPRDKSEIDDRTLSAWEIARKKYGPDAVLRISPSGKIYNQNKPRLEGGIWEAKTWDGGRLKKKQTMQNTACAKCGKFGHWARDCPELS